VVLHQTYLKMSVYELLISGDILPHQIKDYGMGFLPRDRTFLVLP
jgi:hypothetical protein